jgi:hypothetical protein
MASGLHLYPGSDDKKASGKFASDVGVANRQGAGTLHSAPYGTKNSEMEEGDNVRDNL